MAGMNSNLGPAVGTKLRQRSATMPSAYTKMRIGSQSIVKQSTGSGGGGNANYRQDQGGGGSGGGGASPGVLACPPTMPWWLLLLAAAGTIETVALIGFHR